METNPMGMHPGNGQTTEPVGRKDGGADASDAGSEEPTAIDEIREKGFLAYVEEVHARKMEELRAKILETMGLTEEELRALPAEQRQAIEDIIAEKIRRHMMTDSATNGGNGPFTVLTGDGASGFDSAAPPGADGPTGNGFDTGLALLQAIEQVNSTFEKAKDRSDG